MNQKRAWIEPNHPSLSIRSQCGLIGLTRSSYYNQPAGESPENLDIMEKIDRQYMKTPFYGSRRFTAWLEREHEIKVNRKRVQRLMRLMRIEAIYQKPKFRASGAQHKIYPYRLKDVHINTPNHVWASDITYIPMRQGFMYLVAIMDWHSRFVLAWELSNTMDVSFCMDALQQAFLFGKPEIFNSDQGSQFTSNAFTESLCEKGILISMDSKGRCFDNIFIERLWRTVKYEDVYIRDYEDVPSLFTGMESYFHFYNFERVHQALGYRTPAEVYEG